MHVQTFSRRFQVYRCNDAPYTETDVKHGDMLIASLQSSADGGGSELIELNVLLILSIIRIVGMQDVWFTMQWLYPKTSSVI